jgi:ribosomal protein S12 methylthiotransferase accessory factor
MSSAGALDMNFLDNGLASLLGDPARLCPILAGIGKIQGNKLRIRLADEIVEVVAPVRYLDKLFDWCQGDLSLAQISERSIRHFGRGEFADFVVDMLAAGVLIDSALGLQHFARTLEKTGKRTTSKTQGPGASAMSSRPISGRLINVGPPSKSKLLSLATRRESAITFGGGEFAKEHLSALLASAYGVGKGGHRVVASAGGFYPLVVNLVLFNDVEDVTAGSYRVHFDADATVHLEALHSADTVQVPKSLADPGAMRGASGWLLISSDMRIGATKYGNRAFSHALIEAGSVVQDIALIATELGFGWRTTSVVDMAHTGSLFGSSTGFTFPIVGGLFGNHGSLHGSLLGNSGRVLKIHFEWTEKSASLPFHIGRAEIILSEPLAPISGWGRDVTPSLAYDKALAEAVERYAYRRLGVCREARWGTLSDMCAPQALVSYLPSQYRSKHFPYKPFDPDQPYLWCEAIDIHTTAKHWVLADCVYASSSLPPKYRAHLLTAANSSGCASGRSEQEAQHSALFEVVERDAFMRHWFAQRGGKSIRIDSLPATWVARIRRLAESNRYVSIQMLDLGLFPVWLIFVQDRARHFTSVSAAAGMVAELSFESALSEIETAVYARLASDCKTVLRPVHVKSPDDHAEIYTHPRYFDRADALGYSSDEIDYGAARKFFPQNADAVEKRLKQAGTCALWVDMTLPGEPTTLDGTHLVSGRILVPYAIPMTFGHGQLPLGMDVFAKREARFPHPFP